MHFQSKLCFCTVQRVTQQHLLSDVIHHSLVTTQYNSTHHNTSSQYRVLLLLLVVRMALCGTLLILTGISWLTVTVSAQQPSKSIHNQC